MNGTQTYTIREISGGIERALHSAFPEKLWVVGEIQGLDRARHGKHWYFQLCETEAGGEVCRLSATIWKGIRDRLFGPNGTLTGVMNLDEQLDGIKIRALCRLDFYAPYGKVSLHVQDIDPAYTLGDLEAKRQALIDKLTKLGTLHMNSEKALVDVPLKIGLITSGGSAAYNDFVKELNGSGIGFQLLLCDARMQGKQAVPTVRGAFAALGKHDPDAIVLVRGGGSRLDLSWFDCEEIVQEIIRCPQPVITGIGHEIDVTISEMAAFAGLKTPTAAAGFLVERVRGYMDRTRELVSGVAAAARALTDLEKAGLKESASHMVSYTRMVLLEEEGDLRESRTRLVSAARMLNEKRGTELEKTWSRLAAGPYVRRLDQLRISLSRATLMLDNAWQRRCEKETHAADLMAERLRLLDPRRTVSRGYAVIRNSEGKTVKSVEMLNRSDRIVAELRDGRITSRVEDIEKVGSNAKKEKRQLKIW